MVLLGPSSRLSGLVKVDRGKVGVEDRRGIKSCLNKSRVNTCKKKMRYPLCLSNNDMNYSNIA